MMRSSLETGQAALKAVCLSLAGSESCTAPTERDRSTCWALTRPAAVLGFYNCLKSVYCIYAVTRLLTVRRIDGSIYETDDDHDANYSNCKKIS